MDALGILKPLLTNLFLPPSGLLLLLGLGCVLARHRKRLAWALVGLSLTMSWVLSCQATAHGLGRWLLHSYPALTETEAKKAQAIVVLGAGVHLYAPEYGEPVLGPHALARLHYGAYLKQQTGLPMLFAGGKGWGSSAAQDSSEAEVAANTLLRSMQMPIEWLDKTSRDTRESALRTYEVLAPLGKTSILLVTNDWHMARSVKQFEKAGFHVIPAPMGYLQPPQNPLLDYLPTTGGLGATHIVLKEWLGQLLT